MIQVFINECKKESRTIRIGTSSLHRMLLRLFRTPMKYQILSDSKHDNRWNDFFMLHLPQAKKSAHEWLERSFGSRWSGLAFPRCKAICHMHHQDLFYNLFSRTDTIELSSKMVIILIIPLSSWWYKTLRYTFLLVNIHIVDFDII